MRNWKIPVIVSLAGITLAVTGYALGGTNPLPIIVTGAAFLTVLAIRFRSHRRHLQRMAALERRRDEFDRRIRELGAGQA